MGSREAEREGGGEERRSGGIPYSGKFPRGKNFVVFVV